MHALENIGVRHAGDGENTLVSVKVLPFVFNQSGYENLQLIKICVSFKLESYRTDAIVVDMSALSDFTLVLMIGVIAVAIVAVIILITVSVSVSVSVLMPLMSMAVAVAVPMVRVVAIAIVALPIFFFVKKIGRDLQNSLE